jgi:hypothetical protein
MRPPASRTSYASTVLDDLDASDDASGTTVVLRDGCDAPRYSASLLQPVDVTVPFSLSDSTQ